MRRKASSIRSSFRRSEPSDTFVVKPKYSRRHKTRNHESA